MSTRSLIGAVQEDGSVKFIYCHSDGYISGVGATLSQHYSERAKVEELLALGDISSLGEVIGEKHDFDWMGKAMMQKGVNYQDDPRYKMVLAYGRDRGETDIEAKDAPDAATFYITKHGTEYWYLLDREGVWFVKAYNGEPDVLRAAIAKDAAGDEEGDED